MARTMKVSMRMPSINCEAELEDVEEWECGEDREGSGEDDAGGCDDSSGAGDGVAGAFNQTSIAGLFSDAGHDVDVVVGTESDEENEDEGYGVEGHAIVSEDVFEDEDGHSECGGEAEDDADDEVGGCDDAAEEDGQNDPDGDDDDRRDDAEIADGGCSSVEVGRRFAADYRSGAT